MLPCILDCLTELILYKLLLWKKTTDEQNDVSIAGNAEFNFQIVWRLAFLMLVHSQRWAFTRRENKHAAKRWIKGGTCVEVSDEHDGKILYGWFWVNLASHVSLKEPERMSIPKGKSSYKKSSSFATYRQGFLFSGFAFFGTQLPWKQASPFLFFGWSISHPLHNATTCDGSWKSAPKTPISTEVSAADLNPPLFKCEKERVKRWFCCVWKGGIFWAVCGLGFGEC